MPKTVFIAALAPVSLLLAWLTPAARAMPPFLQSDGLSCEELFQQAYVDYKSSPELLAILRWNDEIEGNLPSYELAARGFNENYLSSVTSQELRMLRSWLAGQTADAEVLRRRLFSSPRTDDLENFTGVTCDGRKFQRTMIEIGKNTGYADYVCGVLATHSKEPYDKRAEEWEGNDEVVRRIAPKGGLGCAACARTVKRLVTEHPPAYFPETEIGTPLTKTLALPTLCSTWQVLLSSLQGRHEPIWLWPADPAWGLGPKEPSWAFAKYKGAKPASEASIRQAVLECMKFDIGVQVNPDTLGLADPRTHARFKISLLDVARHGSGPFTAREIAEVADPRPKAETFAVFWEKRRPKGCPKNMVTKLGEAMIEGEAAIVKETALPAAKPKKNRPRDGSEIL